jgi:hypothetical protein
VVHENLQFKRLLVYFFDSFSIPRNSKIASGEAPDATGSYLRRVINKRMNGIRKSMTKIIAIQVRSLLLG